MGVKGGVLWAGLLTHSKAMTVFFSCVSRLMPPLYSIYIMCLLVLQVKKNLFLLLIWDY